MSGKSGGASPGTRPKTKTAKDKALAVVRTSAAYFFALHLGQWAQSVLASTQQGMEHVLVAEQDGWAVGQEAAFFWQHSEEQPATNSAEAQTNRASIFMV
ncbi:MAG: hypothetical protein NTZ16_00050 [Verrucomicrobia bacterium]|nr:hypothetical protein [Verrucomicrobiota bacterium]